MTIPEFNKDVCKIIENHCKVVESQGADSHHGKNAIAEIMRIAKQLVNVDD